MGEKKTLSFLKGRCAMWATARNKEVRKNQALCKAQPGLYWSLEWAEPCYSFLKTPSQGREDIAVHL